jgi:hypothetical protein
MSSKAQERSIGQAIANYRIIGNHVASISGYIARTPELEAPKLLAKTDTFETSNIQEAARRQVFRNLAGDRSLLYHVAPGSIDKTITTIHNAVDSQFGRSSVQNNYVMEIIRDLRGLKPVKIGTKTDEETMSQSHLAYATMVARFGDLITVLDHLSPAYAPVNPAVKIPALQFLFTQAKTANTDVQTAFFIYKHAILDRDALHAELHEEMKQVKDSLAEQFGRNSWEYKTISGIFI